MPLAVAPHSSLAPAAGAAVLRLHSAIHATPASALIRTPPEVCGLAVLATRRYTEPWWLLRRLGIERNPYTGSIAGINTKKLSIFNVEQVMEAAVAAGKQPTLSTDDLVNLLWHGPTKPPAQHVPQPEDAADSFKPWDFFSELYHHSPLAAAVALMRTLLDQNQVDPNTHYYCSSVGISFTPGSPLLSVDLKHFPPTAGDKAFRGFDLLPPLLGYVASHGKLNQVGYIVRHRTARLLREFNPECSLELCKAVATFMKHSRVALKQDGEGDALATHRQELLQLLPAVEAVEAEALQGVGAVQGVQAVVTGQKV